MNSPENQVKRLTVDDIEIPVGMWRAAISDGRMPDREQGLVRASLNLALLWLAENPQMPKLEWLRETIDSANLTLTTPVLVGLCIAEWQRIMFRRKQEELPEEVKRLVALGDKGEISVEQAVRTAWKLGKEGK